MYVYEGSILLVVLLVAQGCDRGHLYRKISFELLKIASILYKTILFFTRQELRDCFLERASERSRDATDGHII
jgi:hypothetical protein